jgi:hypothetical protein
MNVATVRVVDILVWALLMTSPRVGSRFCSVGQSSVDAPVPEDARIELHDCGLGQMRSLHGSLRLRRSQRISRAGESAYPPGVILPTFILRGERFGTGGAGRLFGIPDLSIGSLRR